ncbi:MULTISPECIES: exonuclease domain-containing protein [Rhodomicrobium]|uniref:exonuclease domain-containing protein n=1 Tax=Rhodomicrobium TaxID=1068 RepID=UPI000B4BAA47|nr:MULTISPECIES: exonuclease domain-containing protein [Rhodomicrobium]
MKLPTLPTYYYLDHFAEMLSFVETTYAAVLDPAHREFISDFRRLPPGEQCLFVRMVNRRGQIFEPAALKYAEIADIGMAVRGLFDRGYLRALREDDYAAWLCVLPKTRLLDIARGADCESVRSSWTKPRLVDHLLTHVPFAAAICQTGAASHLALAGTQPLEFLLYLYFGKTCEDLKSFALRDLGILRVNDAASFKSRFSDAAEARACFFYSQLLDTLAVPTLSTFEVAAQKLRDGPEDGGEYARTLRERSAFAIGQFFERAKDPERAVELYRTAPSPECNERLVRLLHAAGAKDEAKRLLERMIDDPSSDDEHVFAQDFYARKFDGRRTGACTELLRAGRQVVVDEIYRGNPEAGVAGVMRRDGFQVYHAENLLWHNLFGLLFWDKLFESGQLHSGFDWMPQCLKNRSFATLFAGPIAEKLASIRAGTALHLILKSIASHWDRPNGIFSWSYIDVDALRDLLTYGNANAVADIIELMTRDFRSMRDGFPDLMLQKDGAISFLEIKAEGDAIRRNQLTRLRQLQAAGFDAVICRADYRFDPEQDYVVIDIETTGGWAPSDRITEIGAVKLRNHQVIDRWHSLINPQRSIPPNITRLTGITNEMVRDAPVFADIADSLMEFMGDGIFVAHNVNFDYGFIAQEYTRLDRRFRFPKFCTCAGMRRHYPGHNSYSLGSLCGIYEISLEHHHRALCDAEAAAMLLNLINRTREGRTLRDAA